MRCTKISQAGFRVLEVLKELAKRPLTPLEMLRYLEDTTDNMYRKEVVLKYINTLKLLNIDIVKVDDKYCLQKSIERIDFDKRDLSVILFMKKYADNIEQEGFKDNIYAALQIIEQSFSAKTAQLAYSKTFRSYKPQKPLKIRDTNVKKFEDYCIDGQRLKLTYKVDKNLEETVHEVLPIKLIYKKGKAVLIAHNHDENEYQEFVLSCIISVVQQPQKYIQGSPSSVLFKLKNRLAKAYVTKPGEDIIERGDNFIIVSNKGEDKELLIRRLLRYHDQCEVLYPKACRERLIDLVKEMEAIYAC